MNPQNKRTDNESPNQQANDVSQYYPSDETYYDDADVFYSYDQETKGSKRKSRPLVTKFTASQLILLAIVFLVYTAVIVTASWLIFYRPATSPTVPFETEDQSANEKPPLDNQETQAGEKDPVEDSANAYVPIDGVYNILVVGRDSAATLADVTMIVNLNTSDKSVSIMQIPRDTFVNLGLITNKVNEAYSSYVSAAYKDGESNTHLAALEDYISLFEKNLCIDIHHGVVLNLEAFIELVDLFGGVDVYVPATMTYNDPEQDLYINIGEGMQHLDGYNAMCFVRYRSGWVQADLGRVNAQKIFMTAFLQKVKSSVSLSNLGLISDIANTIFNNVVTNMSVSDIIFYGKALIGMDLSNINMLTAPGNIDMWSSYYVLNQEATLNAINRYFNIYQTPITATIFDKNHVFCDDDRGSICNIYYGDASEVLDGVYNAEDINEDSIYIPGVTG